MLSQVISEFMPAAYLLAQLTVCPIQPPPKVDIVFTREKAYYDQSMSARGLTEKMREEKDSTFASHEGWATTGATVRALHGKLVVYFNTLSDKTGNTCLYVDTATFRIHYAPAIFIAREVVDIPCTYKTTKEHEQLHVAIDITTIEEYIPKLKVEVLQYLRSLGYFGFGPYTPENAKKKRDQLVKEISKADDAMSERLNKAARDRQGSIDTRESYMAEQAKCPQDSEELSKRLYHATKDLAPAGTAKQVPVPKN